MIRRKQWLGSVRRYADILKLFLIQRLALFLIVYIGLVIVPVKVNPPLWQIFPDNLLLDGWARWDSAYYVEISQRGYWYDHKDLPQDTSLGFFPLYPLLIKLTTPVVGSPYVAGIMLSNFFFAVSLIMVYKFAGLFYKNRAIGLKTALIVATFPFSLFFSAVYSESLFLFLTITSFYFAEREEWTKAGVVAAAAGLTRIVGFVQVIALAFLYLEKHNFKIKSARPLLIIFLGFTGPLIYAVYLWYQFGNPLYLIKSQQAMTYYGGNSLERLGLSLFSLLSIPRIVSGTIQITEVLNALVLLALTVYLVTQLKKWRLSYRVWMLGLIILAVFGWRSSGRYLSVLFPLFLHLAESFDDTAFFLWISVSSLLLAILAFAFSHWMWVG